MNPYVIVLIIIMLYSKMQETLPCTIQTPFPLSTIDLGEFTWIWGKQECDSYEHHV